MQGNSTTLVHSGVVSIVMAFFRHLPSTTDKVSAKWSQQPQLPAPADAPLLTQGEVAELFPLEALDRAVQRLHVGAAPDAMGWYAESFSTLYRRPTYPQVLSCP